MSINAYLLHDKPLHFAYGALITQPVVALAKPLPYTYRVALGLSVGLLAGVVKEWIDSRHDHSLFSLGDVLATTLGGLFTGALS